MTYVRAILLAIAVACAALSTVFAQPGAPAKGGGANAVGDPRVVCADDIKKFCPDQAGNPMTLPACMRSRANYLSGPCQTALKSLGLI